MSILELLVSIDISRFVCSRLIDNFLSTPSLINYEANLFSSSLAVAGIILKCEPKLMQCLSEYNLIETTILI